MKDNEGYITATLNVQDQNFVKYEIEQSVIVGLEERLKNIEERLDNLEHLHEVMFEMLKYELHILENPKSTWVANSKGGV